MASRISRILAAGMVGGLLAGFASYALAQDKVMVGGVLYGRDSQYWRLIERGMTDAAAANNAELTIGLNGRQLATEAQVVEDMMTRGVKAIIISILDENASAAILRDARERDIVVVEDGTHLKDKTVANYSVEVDQKEAARVVGVEMVNYIKNELGGKAKVGLAVLPPQNPQATDRNGTIVDMLKELPGVEIVAQVNANTPETGANAAEQILQRAPDTDIIYAANAGSLEGVVVAVAQSQAKAKVFGLDLSKAIAEALLDPNGALVAVSDQDPYNVGYKAAEAGIKGARNEMGGAAREIPLPVKLYTKQTTDMTKAYIELVDKVNAQ